MANTDTRNETVVYSVEETKVVQGGYMPTPKAPINAIEFAAAAFRDEAQRRAEFIRRSWHG